MNIDLGSYSYQELRNTAECKACNSKSLGGQLMSVTLSDLGKFKKQVIYIYIYIYILCDISPFPFNPTAPRQPAVSMIALGNRQRVMIYGFITL